MPEHPSIELRDVRKKYVIRHESARSFQSMALALLGRRAIEHEEFWALDGVDVAVKSGETLGIIGPNGSGKSTILKLLAGTIRPTTGTVQTRGEVFGLLELGAGMHPDLTGRENIFLNGAFLGMGRARVQQLYPQIVEFAELEQFIDMPVKHFSSGMFMRLGFAIAVNIDPDILLIDEVLAVGDARFAAKCYEALADVKRRGRTIVFVSHDPIQVRRFCDRVLWLERGRVRMLGAPQEVIQAYLRHMRGASTSDPAGERDPATEEGTFDVRIRAAVLLDAERGDECYSYLPGGVATLRLELETAAYREDVVVGWAIRRSDGLLVAESSTETTIGPLQVSPQRTLIECRIGPLPLGAGAYQVSVSAWPAGNRLQPYHLWRRALTFFVGKATGSQRGTTVVPAQWRASAAHPDEPLVGDGRPVAQPDMVSVTGGPVWSPPPSVLTIGERDDEWLGPGWYPAEDWPPRVRWTTRRAVAYVTQEPGSEVLTVTACRPLHDTSEATARLLLDGEHVATFRVSSMDFEDIAVPLDPVDEAKVREVVIEVDDALVPAAVGLEDDTRPLGLAVRSLRVE